MNARSSVRRIAAALAAFALTATPLARARAQDVYGSTPSRYAIELYLAQYWLDVPGRDREGLGGVGARMMFGRGDVTKAASSLFNRARAGVFATYTSEQKDVSTWHVGGQLDVPLFAAPVASGVLDPFVSLGAGLFRSSVDVIGRTDSRNDFAFTPAVGTLVPVTGAIKFRGDLRDVIVFGDDRTNNFVAEAGISVGF